VVTAYCAAAQVPLRAQSRAQPGDSPATPVQQYFDRVNAPRLVPMLQEVLRFPTVAADEKAHADQKAWLFRTATSLGLVARDAGLVTEIDLPGPAGAPVLGLIIHSDVQPVEEKAWSVPPFAGVIRQGAVWGRGAVDNKGALVQALLAMGALREAGPPRTHTIRLLVGSDEESANLDMATYLKDHPAPAYSLVLDALFPVVVGEKAWNALRVSVDPREDAQTPAAKWEAASLDGGLSPSIVPDRARLTLRWRDGEPRWQAVEKRLRERKPRPGTRLEITSSDRDLIVDMHGRAAHSGMNIAGGRNALVSLAHVASDVLPPSGIRDLLRFIKIAASDIRGAGLDLPPPDRLWHGYDVTPATVIAAEGRTALTVNIRRPPPWRGADLQSHLARIVERFNRAHGSRLRMDQDFYYSDEPFEVALQSPLVARLLAVYRRATGEKQAVPVVMGGGSYAKRVPRSIAFGMWFAERPYPGHDVDERIPIADLSRGARVLVEALVDIGCGAPLGDTPLFAPPGN
jgi:succinyl-diaminopimelate desuccinylase